MELRSHLFMVLYPQSIGLPPLNRAKAFPGSAHKADSARTRKDGVGRSCGISLPLT